MAENSDGQEKSEKASSKRLEDGRLKGQVTKSVDVTTAAILLVGGASIFIFGIPLINNYMNFMGYVLANSWNIDVTYQNFVFLYPKILYYMGLLILPIVVTIFVITLVAEISQVGFKIATKKFEELDDLKKIFKIGEGIKKIFFSSRSIFELVKNFSKIFILGIVILWTLWGRFDEIVSIAEKPIEEIGSLMGSLAFDVLLKMSVLYLFIAIGDYIFQKWKFNEDMKMTKQEVKDEHKQMEGDPKVKSQLRSLMRARIRRMMIESVKDADVVITNPTHFAVAIKYDQYSMSAPKVVAKGVDFIAQQIREKAKDNNIIIYEAPPLARALFYNVEVNDEIPEDLFKAVAEVLAYVYSLKSSVN